MPKITKRNSSANSCLHFIVVVTALAYCGLMPDIANAAPTAEAWPQSEQINPDETQLGRRMAARDTLEHPFEYALGVGYRQDNLKWSIADGAVNVASEVEWKSTAIRQIRAAGKLQLANSWQLRGAFSTGAVMSGNNQDADYAGADRTDAYSISNNQSGGAVRDLSVGVGKRYRAFAIIHGVESALTPLVGMSVHQQSFTMIDGVQTLPAVGSFPNLNNSYDTKWQGPWLGLELSSALDDRLTIAATGEYHWADYSAEANWNLRNEFAHPVSFQHIASGRGLVTTVEGAYRFSKNALMNASVAYQAWETSGGYDRTYFASSTTSIYPLNTVRWNSWALSIGMMYQL